MLWLYGKNILEAKTFYEKKYGRTPDTIEMNSSLADKIGILPKEKAVEGMNINRTKYVMNGCLLLGIQKDEDATKYLIEE